MRILRLVPFLVVLVADIPAVGRATEHFLRAWRGYLFDTFDPAQREPAAAIARRALALDDLREAVRLAPQEALFANSLMYLEHQRCSAWA